jgi:predicted CXXCH cytochrome family protein
MKRSIATGLVLAPAAALLLSAQPARSELWTEDALARETSGCALGRVSRRSATTATCLSCHDGLSASGIGYSSPGVAGARFAHGSHPVDVDYNRASMKPQAQYRPLSALPSSLVLTDGKVTCVTCHDGSSSEPAHTSLPMDRSRLCFGCHDL